MCACTHTVLTLGKCLSQAARCIWHIHLYLARIQDALAATVVCVCCAPDCNSPFTPSYFQFSCFIQKVLLCQLLRSHTPAVSLSISTFLLFLPSVQSFANFSDLHLSACLTLFALPFSVSWALYLFTWLCYSCSSLLLTLKE